MTARIDVAKRLAILTFPPSRQVSTTGIVGQVGEIAADARDRGCAALVVVPDRDGAVQAIVSKGLRIARTPDGLLVGSSTSLRVARIAKQVEPYKVSKMPNGLEVHIDRPAGFRRPRYDATGKEIGEVVYSVDYGYLADTDGGDGEELDVYCGPVVDASIAYMVTQNKPDGTFDEYKLMVGFASAEDAQSVYEFHAGRPPGEIVAVEMDHVLALMGCPPSKVVAEAKSVDVAKAAGREAKIVHVNKGEERYILGVVLEPDPLGGAGDKQGDTYTAETVRAACHGYMERHTNHPMKVQHKGPVVTGQKLVLLENYIAPIDMMIEGVAVKAGTWLMAVRVIDDALWTAVKEGRITGFSIGGDAIKIDMRDAA